jgi:hypothetical protein
MPENIIACDASEQADEELWADEEDSRPARPPVGLLSVTRALHRNWQVVDSAPRQQSDTASRSADQHLPVQRSPERRPALQFEDEHYLSTIGEKLKRSAAPEADSGSELLAEIWRLVTQRTHEQLRSLEEVREQLAGELEKFAHLLPCPESTPAKSRRDALSDPLIH